MAAAIAVDASVSIRAAVDGEEAAIDAFALWNRAGFDLVAPDLWLPEVISAVRRSVAYGVRPDEDAARVIENLFKLPVQSVATDRDLAHATLRWSSRIGQAKAYDALYLAVAERYEAPLVTADIHLLNRCRQLGIDFVEGLPAAAG